MAKMLSILRAVGQVGKRIYAFILVVVLLYVFYLAVSYLVTVVFYPSPVPARLTEWAGHLEASALRQPDVPGVTGPAARAPFSHYHQVGQWMQLDPINGCTISGCHEPLPHTRSVYVRAFANFHATFLTCQMCHETTEARPVKAGWVDTQTGLATDPPGLVDLMRLLDTDRDRIMQEPATYHEPILLQLAEVVAVSRDPRLQYIHLEIATTVPGSPVWRDAVVRLMEELPLHARGEYGAKIARLDGPDDYLRESDELRETAKRFLAAAPEAPERKRVQDEIHAAAKMLVAPDRCMACHGDSPPLIDFTSLGYSPQRASFLTSVPTAQQVQSIREGRQFYLPRITEEGR